MISFEFATAARIIFGPGVVGDVGRHAAEFGRRALVTSGLDEERSRPLLQVLSDAGIETSVYPVAGEPVLEQVAAGVELARSQNCELVIGVGGGSAIDMGKAISALVANPGEILDYLEVVGRGRPIQNPPLPFIAIPTTAGTGSEVTRNAVIGVPQRQVKVSLRSPLMLAKIAIVDPELTLSLPPEVTASTGMDALTQIIEPFTCNRPNRFVDALCESSLREAGWLRRAYEDGKDLQARQAMSLVALFSGMALANAKLGAVHGFAAVLGGMYPAPHGAICARLLPYVVETNVTAINGREPENGALERYRRMAALITGQPVSVTDGITWLHTLSRDLNIPPLRSYGMTAEDFPAIVAKAAKASSMQGNPIRLTESEMTGILERAL